VNPYTSGSLDTGGDRELPPSLLGPSPSHATGVGLTESAVVDQTGCPPVVPTLLPNVPGRPRMLGLRPGDEDRAPDASLIRRAREIVDSIDPGNSYESPSDLAALAGLLMEMWESAQGSSDLHQDILAVLETAVRQAAECGSVTLSHLSFFREALTDLALPRLVRENAEVIRSKFVSEGFAALPFLHETERLPDEEDE